MTAIITDGRLPTFNETEAEMVKGSYDYIELIITHLILSKIAQMIAKAGDVITSVLRTNIMLQVLLLVLKLNQTG